LVQPSYAYKQYNSALQRFLKPAIINLLENTFPSLFGRILSEKMADELIKLFDSVCPETKRLKPGQLLWLALDKNTRGDSPRRRFVPVILTVVSEDDINQLKDGANHKKVTNAAKARMFYEAYEQNGILSSRDVSLISLTHYSAISYDRVTYEKQNNCVLPHTGALHDMGSTITHKNMIIRKIIYEKKDPAQVAKECNHSQRAVDRYLKDYYRVASLYKENKNIDFIHHVTGISRAVVVQYLKIINNEK